jgi:AAA15 family ATPase/GTPase
MFLPQGINGISIGVHGLDKQRIAQLWEKITLTEYEQEVLNALRIIAPGSEAISVITRNERTPIVKVRGISEPLPIRGLGDGMQRMLGIALALVNAQNGLLLIDEIENGLHYSILADLWKLMFQVAHRLNVQVFVTTHSWDCITAFQEVAQAEENEEGLLIRLQYKKDDIVSTIFDEEDLAIITRDRIEVR